MLKYFHWLLAGAKLPPAANRLGISRRLIETCIPNLVANAR
ncbi:MAG: hypothetical protein ACN6OP_21175 [Pseudomonadales bacterium]